MLNKSQKQEIVKNLTEELKGAKGAVLSSFQGLPASVMQTLRQKLRAEGIKSKVVKLTLLKRVLAAIGVNTENFNQTVPVVVSWSTEDELSAARILHGFAKKQENLKIVAGLLEQKLLDAAAVKTLATLPGKQELLGQLVGVVASPLRGLVGVLSGNVRQLLYALNAIGKSKS